MHPAKKFFYVCAGLLMLAGAYAMGARSAGAQGGQPHTAVGATVYGQSTLVLASDGSLFASHWQDRSWQYMGQVTPQLSAPFVALVAGDQLYAVEQNGNVFVHPTTEPFGTWEPFGNAFFGGPVNVQQHTLGQLKQRFRAQPTGK